jgi:NifU-like protein involved in Fe-S cluster formation
MSDAVYNQAIVALARAAHGDGRLQPAGLTVHVDNPLCGDRIDLDVRLDAGRVEAIAHHTRGCLLCRAAASLLGLRGPGQDLAALLAAGEALQQLLEGHVDDVAGWPEMQWFTPARAHRSRHGCLRLPFEALGRLAGQEAAGAGAAGKPGGA